MYLWGLINGSNNDVYTEAQDDSGDGDGDDDRNLLQKAAMCTH